MRRRPSRAGPGPGGRRDAPARTRASSARARRPRWRSSPAARACRGAASSRARTPRPGYAALRTTSATIAIAGSRLRLSTSKETRALSRPAAAVSATPRSPSASSISSALRVAVPMSICVAVRWASPPCRRDPPSAPARVDERDVDLRQLGALDDEQVHAVGQLRRLDRRRDEGPVDAGRRLLRAVDGDLGGAARLLDAEAHEQPVLRVEVLRHGLPHARPASRCGSAPCPTRACPGSPR